MPERATVLNRSEKSAEAALAASLERRAKRGGVFKTMSMQQAKRQTPAQAGRVGVAHGEAARDRAGDEACRPVRVRMPGGMACSQLYMVAPYADRNLTGFIGVELKN